MKNKSSFFFYLFIISISYGCSLDDRYHYTLSYRIANQTDNPISGILIRDSTFYSNPSLNFEIESGKTMELFTGDGGDGATVSPPYRQGLLAMKELRINTDSTSIIINVESDEKWKYTTEESIGIYTFLITEDLLEE